MNRPALCLPPVTLGGTVTVVECAGLFSAPSGIFNVLDDRGIGTVDVGFYVLGGTRGTNVGTRITLGGT